MRDELPRSCRDRRGQYDQWQLAFHTGKAGRHFALHTWSEKGRDDGASRIKKNSIYNASSPPTVEGLMLQQVHDDVALRSCSRVISMRAAEVGSKRAR